MMTPVSTRTGALRRPLQAMIVCLFAALAMALAPASALGGATDQYTEEPPSASGGNDPQNSGISSSPSSGQGSSGSGDGSSGGGAGSAGGGGGGGENAAPSPGGSDGAASGAGGGSGQGTAEGGAGQGSNASGGSAFDNPAGAGSSGTAEGAATASSSDEDDSYPLLPILIGILLLAALSIGAVLLRNRRQAGNAAQAADTA